LDEVGDGYLKITIIQVSTEITEVHRSPRNWRVRWKKTEKSLVKHLNSLLMGNIIEYDWEKTILLCPRGEKIQKVGAGEPQFKSCIIILGTHC
jgi:hypothetical protein